MIRTCFLPQMLMIGLVMFAVQISAQENSVKKDWRLNPADKTERAALKPDEVVVDTAKRSGLTATKIDSTNDRVHGDSRVTELIDRHIRINKDRPATIPGYRIQLDTKSGPGSQKKARQIQLNFIKEYPDIPSYSHWQDPNFVVKVGDFRSRMEALRFYQYIKEEYPSSIVVRDNISLPELGAEPYKMLEEKRPVPNNQNRP